MNNYKREYRHKQYCEKIKLNPDMIDKENAEFLLYVDGMMGCRLSPAARKMCHDRAEKESKG